MFFQARDTLVLVLMFFCAPVFSLNSYIDTDKYTASFSQHYDSNHSIDNCFDSSVENNSFCASVLGGSMSIIFNEPSDVTNLNLILVSSSFVYDYLDVDGLRYEYEPSSLYNFSNVKNITVFATNYSYVYLKEITFDFETVNTGGDIETGNPGANGGNISDGVNWSMFSFSFTIIGILAMTGRGIKAILDLIKYG